MNTVQLVGRLTRDIELKQTQNGTPYASFNLAVNRDFKNQDGEREADFPLCVVWRKQAEVMAQYLSKGSQVGVEGQLRTRNYENQQGQRVYVTEVIVDKFHFLEPRRDDQKQSQNNGFQQSQQNQGFQQQQNTGFAPSNNQQGFGEPQQRNNQFQQSQPQQNQQNQQPQQNQQFQQQNQQYQQPQQNQQNQYQSPAPNNTVEVSEDDLPF